MQGCDFTQYQVSCSQCQRKSKVLYKSNDLYHLLYVTAKTLPPFDAADNPRKKLSKIKKDIARTSSNKPKV